MSLQAMIGEKRCQFSLRNCDWREPPAPPIGPSRSGQCLSPRPDGALGGSFESVSYPGVSIVTRQLQPSALFCPRSQRTLELPGLLRV